MLNWQDVSEGVRSQLSEGCVIPAHPLALNGDGGLDMRRQRALSRYYIDAGVGGLAVGVHTTQFAIREVGLFAPVLETAAITADDWSDRPLVRIAGLIGSTKQAQSEASTAISLGYHMGLLNLAAFKDASIDELIEHCRNVAEVIPLMGFYLLPEVGGIELPASFWRRFAEIENVVAIKIAAFNRYRTMDVIRSVIEAGAEDRITIYTGNDDHIIGDLLQPFTFMRNDEPITLRIHGGLLGHWSVWTKRAVEMLATIKDLKNGAVPKDVLALDPIVTDCNSAIYDVANQLHGCIPGVHEVLRRQGLLEETRCLDPQEMMSPGQVAEIDRVYRAYPDMNDDAFVAENLARWLS